VAVSAVAGIGQRAGLYSLSRNIDCSIGISVVNSLLTTNTQVDHADIVQHVTAVNRIFSDPTIAQFWNPLTAAGRAALDAMITQQAQIILHRRPQTVDDRDARRDPATHRL
jgi:DHA2 family multidrug resistance protein